MEDSKQRGQLAQRSLDCLVEQCDVVMHASMTKDGIVLINAKGPTEEQDYLLTLLYGMLNPNK